MQFYYALILAAAAAFAVGQDDGKCPGGVSDGQDVVSGAYYYTCKSGALVPGGCMSGTQQKVPIGGTFNTGNVQQSCVSDGSKLTVKATGCFSDNGQAVAIGSTAEAGTVVLQCVQNGDSVDLKVAGCLQNGQRVDIDKTTVQGTQVMMCQRSSNKDAKLVASGCVVSGKQYEIGTQFDDSDTTYHCAKDGEQSKLKPVACVNDGKRVYDLDIFQKGSMAYRCRVGDDKVSADLYGCVVSGDVKSLKCTWDVGTDPINYVNSCIQKDATAVVTQVNCLYTYRGGRVQVDEGCYRVFDKVAAGCQRTPEGSLKMDTFEPTDMTAVASRGLHKC